MANFDYWFAGAPVVAPAKATGDFDYWMAGAPYPIYAEAPAAGGGETIWDDIWEDIWGDIWGEEGGEEGPPVSSNTGSSRRRRTIALTFWRMFRR